MHQFTNFVATSSAPVSLSNTTYIAGKVDITKDGVTQWKAVKVVVMLQNYNVASISVDANATNNHFQSQPIYGITTSLTNAQGTQLIKSATTTTSSIGAIGQNITQGASTAANQTAGFFGNISKGIQNLFNGTKK